MEKDIGIKNENGRSRVRGSQASIFSVAEFANWSSTVDIISEIVLSHHLPTIPTSKPKCFFIQLCIYIYTYTGI